mmetsp:Transcript_10472/g.32500  ORF Transcript_10472/g.32500 Transcript_10472/m.32500 type:complete len:332 (-) Transcript_10472:420-1415(-)
MLTDQLQSAQALWLRDAPLTRCVVPMLPAVDEGGMYYFRRHRRDTALALSAWVHGSWVVIAEHPLAERCAVPHEVIVIAVFCSKRRAISNAEPWNRGEEAVTPSLRRRDVRSDELRTLRRRAVLTLRGEEGMEGAADHPVLVLHEVNACQRGAARDGRVARTELARRGTLGRDKTVPLRAVAVDRPRHSAVLGGWNPSDAVVRRVSCDGEVSQVVVGSSECPDVRRKRLQLVDDEVRTRAPLLLPHTQRLNVAGRGRAGHPGRHSAGGLRLAARVITLERRVGDTEPARHPNAFVVDENGSRNRKQSGRGDTSATLKRAARDDGALMRQSR